MLKILHKVICKVYQKNIIIVIIIIINITIMLRKHLNALIHALFHILQDLSGESEYSIDLFIEMNTCCKPKSFSGRNIIAFCSNQQCF